MSTPTYIFNPVWARDLCLLCDISYDPGSSINVGNLAFIAKDTGDCIDLVMQGTDGCLDLIKDLEAVLCTSKLLPGFGEVPDGFDDCAVQLAQEVRSRLDWLLKMKGPKPIRVAGHSLGAATFLYIAAWLKKLGYDVVCFYGFGTPATGNAAWVTAFKMLGLPAFEVVHACDGVTLVPPWALHAGQLVFLDRYGHQIESRLTFPWWNPFRWNCRLSDHSIDKYEVGLAKLALSA